MSNLPVEAVEPDPAATSISNEETVNKNGGDASAPTSTDSVMADAEFEKPKDEEVKKQEEDTTAQKNGEAAKNGDSKNGSSENHDHKNHEGERKPWFKPENRSKYDPSVLPSSEDPKEIRAQVEFYFGDANLPTDKNMWDNTGGSANKPILIKDIHSFKRMQRFQPYEAVVAALRESKFLDVVGVEGEEKIQRKVAYDPLLSRSSVDDRSIYAKGFGDEEPSSQFDIEAFFAQYGTTNAVRLRRTNDRLFKGSVFVEFQDEETAQKFLKLDPKPLWKGKHELETCTKKAYKDRKEQEIKDGTTKPTESWGPSSHGGYRGRGGRGQGQGQGRGRGRGNHDNRSGRGDREDRGRGRSDRDPDDWKKRREDDRASGFKDSRGKGKDYNKGGRGGRGRRDDRGPRNDDRKRNRDDNNDNDAEAPATKKVDVKSEEAAAPAPTPAPAQNEKKRAREADDEGTGGGPAKKVDVKTEVEAS